MQETPTHRRRRSLVKTAAFEPVVAECSRAMIAAPASVRHSEVTTIERASLCSAASG